MVEAAAQAALTFTDDVPPELERLHTQLVNRTSLLLAAIGRDADVPKDRQFAERLVKHVDSKPELLSDPNTRAARDKLDACLKDFEGGLKARLARVQLASSHVTVASAALPAKVSPTITPLIQAVRFEKHALLQRRSAEALAELMVLCTEQGRQPDPSAKLVRDLVLFATADETQAPAAPVGTATGKRKQGAAEAVAVDPQEAAAELARRGALAGLSEYCRLLGPALFSERTPWLWQAMSQKLLEAPEAADPVELTRCLRLAALVVPVVAAELQPQIQSLLPHALRALLSPSEPLKKAATAAITAVLRSAAVPRARVSHTCAWVT